MPPKRKAPSVTSTEENDEAPKVKKRGGAEAVAPPAPLESEHEDTAASPPAPPSCFFPAPLAQVQESGDDGGIPMRDDTLESRHKVFLSHSGAQKNFVEQLCVDLEIFEIFPFFDKRRDSLPIGKNFPKLIFEAIDQCEVGVVVLSNEFFMRSKWPMLELVAMTKNPKLIVIPVFLGISLEQVRNPENQNRWLSVWRGWAQNDKREINLQDWCAALNVFGPIKALMYDGLEGEVSFCERIVAAVCDVVLPQTRWNDLHIQGRSRLCKVICE